MSYELLVGEDGRIAAKHEDVAGRPSYFIYTGQGRLPQAVTVQTPQGATNYLLGYDQVGSLKAVAAMEGRGAVCSPA